MGAASYATREIRVIFEPELTEVYVHLEASGDCPLGVQGWHHKTFPAATSAVDAIRASVGLDGHDSAVLWPQEAPPR